MKWFKRLRTWWTEPRLEDVTAQYNRNLDRLWEIEKEMAQEDLEMEVEDDQWPSENPCPYYRDTLDPNIPMRWECQLLAGHKERKHRLKLVSTDET